MEDVSPVMTCVSGPDTGRQFAIKGGATTLGTGAGCHVESADPVLTGMQVTFTLADGRVTFEATDADVVEVDGVAQTIGAVRPGQQVRIGTSIWQLADEDAARQFAGFLGRVGGHIGAAAGLGRVEGFSVREMFSEVFKRHPDEEVDAYFSIGSPATTPSLADLGTAWPRPWVFARAATLSVLLYLGFSLAIGKWDNPKLVPGMMFAGTFAIPCSVLLFFFEVNVPRNISLYQVIKMMLLGAILSLCLAMVGFGLTRPAGHWLGEMIAGPVEETAKFLPLLLVINKLKYRWTLNGLLMGATVGCGFAAFESAGYAFYYGILVERSIEAMRDNIEMRGALTLCGGHIAWTALVGAAIWKVRGQGRFRWSMVLDPRFLRIFAISVAMHMIWNSRIPSDYYLKYLVLGFIAWTLVIAFIHDGLKQVRTAQAALEAEGEGEGTTDPPQADG